MQTTPAFRGLACRDCRRSYEAAEAAGRCPDCDGALDPEYDYGAVDLALDDLAAGPRSMWRFDALLPFPAEAAVTMGEGATPLVDCPALADELGVDRLLIKDEGHNPTGSLADRELSLAITAAAASGVTDVGLPSAGDDGQAAAAYAARAGLDAHVFVPSRAGFVRKAMINVHGGDMTVVGGRLDDAADACREAMDGSDGWLPFAPFETPYRHEAAKTVLYEIVADLGAPPDAVVHPTGSGTGIVGSSKAARELVELGVIDDPPALYAAQASGCAPIVRAVEEGEPVRRWEHPDTICGSIEVPEPAGGGWAVEAIRETGGGAVATDDDAILESAAAVAASEGVSTSPSSAAAASGAWALTERGDLGPDDTVVLVNATTGLAAPDVLRSHLMGQGI